MCADWNFGDLFALLGVSGSNSLENESGQKTTVNSYMYTVYPLVLSSLLLFSRSYSFSVYEMFYSIQRKMYHARRIFCRWKSRLRSFRLPSIPYIVQRNIKKCLCAILVALYITILYGSIWYSLFDVGTSLTLVIWLALLTTPLNEILLNFTTRISRSISFILHVTFYIVMLIGFLALVFFWILNGILTMALGISVFGLLNFITHVRLRSRMFHHMNGSAFSRIVRPPPPDRELPFRIRRRLEEDRQERERIRNEERIVPQVEDVQVAVEMDDEVRQLHELRDNEINNVPMAAAVNPPEENVMNGAELEDSQEIVNEEKEATNHLQEVEVRKDMEISLANENEGSVLTRVEPFTDVHFKTESDVEKTNGYFKDDPVVDLDSENGEFIEASNRDSSEYKNECNELMKCRTTDEIEITETIRDGTKEKQCACEIQLSNECMLTKCNVFESHSCSDMLLRQESLENMTAHKKQLSTILAKESDELCSSESLSLNVRPDAIMKYNRYQLEHSTDSSSGSFIIPKENFKRFADLESKKSLILKKNSQYASISKKERYFHKPELVAIDKHSTRDSQEYSTVEHEATIEAKTVKIAPVSTSHSIKMIKDVEECERPETYWRKLESDAILVSAEKECEKEEPKHFEGTFFGSVSLNTPNVWNKSVHSPSRASSKFTKLPFAGRDEQDENSDKTDSVVSARMNFNNTSELKPGSGSEKCDCSISSNPIIKRTDASTRLSEKTINEVRQHIQLTSFKKEADKLVKSASHAKKDGEHSSNESRENDLGYSAAEHTNAQMETSLSKLPEMELDQFASNKNGINVEYIDIEEELYSNKYKSEKTDSVRNDQRYSLSEEYNLNIEIDTDMTSNPLFSSSVIDNQAVSEPNKCISHSDEFESSNYIDDAIKAQNREMPQPTDDLSLENLENGFKEVIKEMERIITLVKKRVNKITKIIPYTRKKIVECTEELESIEAEKKYLSPLNYQCLYAQHVKNEELEEKILKMLSDTEYVKNRELEEMLFDENSTSESDNETIEVCTTEESCSEDFEEETEIENSIEICNIDYTKSSREIPIMNSRKTELRNLSSSLNESLNAVLKNVVCKRNEETVNLEVHKTEEIDRNSVTGVPNQFNNDTGIKITKDSSNISRNLDLTPISKSEVDRFKVFETVMFDVNDLPRIVKECHKNEAKSSANMVLVPICNLPEKEFKASDRTTRTTDEIVNTSFAEGSQEAEYSERYSPTSNKSNRKNTDKISHQYVVHNSSNLDADSLKSSFDSGLSKVVQIRETSVTLKDLRNVSPDQKDSELHERNNKTSMLSVKSTWTNELLPQSFSRSKNKGDKGMVPNTEMSLSNRDEERDARRVESHSMKSEEQESLEDGCQIVQKSQSLKLYLSGVPMNETTLNEAASSPSNSDFIYEESSERESGISQVQGSKFHAESVCQRGIESKSANAVNVKTESKMVQERNVCTSTEYVNTEPSQHTSAEGEAVNTIDPFFIYNVPNVRTFHSFY